MRRSGRIRCISDRVGKLEPVQPSLVAAFTEGVPLDSIPLVAEADERHMRAVDRQERFSSDADSETVLLFRRRQGSTLGVPFGARGGLPRIATNSSRCRVSPLFSRARNLGAGCFVVSNLTIIMEPGVDACPLHFLPLFTQVLRVLAGLTISFSATSARDSTPHTESSSAW